MSQFNTKTFLPISINEKECLPETKTLLVNYLRDTNVTSKKYYYTDISYIYSNQEPLEYYSQRIFKVLIYSVINFFSNLGLLLFRLLRIPKEEEKSIRRPIT